MKQFFSNVAFLFIVLFSIESFALSSGSTTTGNIPNPGDTSNQSFTASAGQGIMLFASSSNYSVGISVSKPDGTALGSGTNRYSATLPVSGTYNVAITAGSPSATGLYEISYLQGGGGVSNGSLSSGTSYNGSLDSNDLNSFQFSGTAGAGIMLFGDAAAYGVYMNVYNPDGSLLTTGNRRVEEDLPTSGTYTVAAYAATTTPSGPYRLDFVQGGEDVSNGRLASGLSEYASLSPNGLESFEFTGISGQEVLIFGNASAYGVYINVYKPDGSFWGSGNRRFDDTLPVTGTYIAVAHAATSSDSGSYRLDYLRGSGNVSDGMLISGSTRSGSLQANGIESYKFTGVSGNSLSVASSGGFTRNLSIFNPDGSFWTSGSNSLSRTMNGTGTYTLVAKGSTTSTSGPYTVTVTTTPNTVPASTPSEVGAPYTACTADASPYEAGNPINFDVGFKKQTEVDYDAGGLKFSRIYRSDSTWTDNTIGTLWRHNYARILYVSGGSASITDGTGATINYTSSGADWIPNNPATTATFETSGSNYIYTLPDNTVEKYNSSKLLTRIEYLGGGALNLGYNGSNQLTSVTNENGRQLTLTYTSNRVNTLGTPDGTFSYTYDGNGNLDEVTNPDTYSREYHYENGSYVNALTGITDEANIRFSSYTYNASGKATLTEQAGNTNDYGVAYNVNGTSTVTNPLGKNTTYNFYNIEGLRQSVQIDQAASTNTPAATRYDNFDELGRVIGTTDWEGNTTRYEYDDRGNITDVYEAYGTTLQRHKTISYIANFNLPDVITESNKTTDYDYDVYGRMTSMTVTDTATSATRITAYTYHANTTDGSGNVILGRLAEIDGPRTDVGDVTAFDYDANFDLETITNPLGQETNITARDSAGRPTTIEDANGIETDLVYSSAGRLISSTVAPGTGLAAQTAYAYDPNGNLTEVTLPNGVNVEYSYDNAQRLTGVEDALGNTITYTLDAAGNVTQEDIHDNSANLKYTHDQVFDELERLIESIGASGQDTDYVYDKNSNMTRMTDANNKATNFAYDGLLRFISSTDALAGVTELGYNGLDDVNMVEDPRNNATTYTYNAFGDVVGEVSPNRGTISYTVDKAGNVTQRVDARGVVTNYTWDALDRLLTIAYPSDSSLNATLTYDLTTGCGTAGIGQLCSVVDASGTTTYEYNDLGQLTEVNETRSGVTYTTAYTYDLAGNVLTITLDSGRVITYTRNGNGLVSGVSGTVAGVGTVQFTSGVSYLPFGPVTGMAYGNGLTLSATYDQDYNPTNRTISGGISNRTYDTDDAGNITQIGSYTYGYDSLNRLNTENSGAATTYTFDATDNRLTKVQGSTTTSTVPSTSNKISAVGGTNITYDSSGNFITYGTTAYSWNAAGQLSFTSTGGATVGTYTYNASNQRTKKVAGANTVQYVYGLNGLLYGEYDNSGAMIREYVYQNDEPLAQIDAGSPEVLTYLHPNHLGTPQYGTNSGGSQVWFISADSYGVGTPSGSRTVNLRMPGQYYDAESGLFYNGNRYYNPALGRYISSDPIGIDGGLNTFNYADISPVMYTDPEGLRSGAGYYIPGAAPLPLPVRIGLEVLRPSTLGNDDCYQNGVNVCSTSDTKPEAGSPATAQDQVCTAASPTGGPDDPDDNSEHAKKRMQERNISQDRIDEAKRIGRMKPGNTPNEKVYEVSSKDSASGRGIRVVVDAQTGRIVTVIDKGGSFK